MQIGWEIKRVLLHAKLLPCAHSCKYCLMGDKRLARLGVERFLRLVERFLAWKQIKRPELKIDYVLDYTSDYDRETMELLLRLEEQFPHDYPPLRGITLGGLPYRSDTVLKEWLNERQAFGCKSVHASFAGVDDIHDYWNGRSGNFDLLIRTLRLAGEAGMSTGARLFVTKSTIPFLEELNNRLEEVPKNAGDWRYALPFFYAGWGSRLEGERIDEDTRDGLPGWLRLLIHSSRHESAWRSEREWICLFQDEPAKQRELNLIINVDDRNLEALECLSCDAIIAEYEARTRAAYALIPERKELCERYGDAENRKVYVLDRCIEMKWLDAHLRAHPQNFERQLTHLQMGH